jgi:cytochrome c oxidase cbb3-type subunit 1
MAEGVLTAANGNGSHAAGVNGDANGHLDARALAAAERAAIDQSTRLPVLVFFGAAVFWLLVGSLLAMLASIKLHNPTFLGGVSWLTFGRVRPAHLNAVVYGWANQAGIGAILWLMARLSRAQMMFPRLLVASAAIWNFGVAVGIVSLLAGYSTGIEWLEFPPYVPPILTLALGMCSVWTYFIFKNRRERHVYVTQWYIFGSLLWMPWVYMVATTMLIFAPVTGVVQGSVNWWFAHNVLGLWITPIGVGAAYYIIPKVIGRPIHSYYLSIMGFWALALFYSWAGTHHLIGGPLPAWFISAGIVGSVMMFLPVGAVALNHHFTMVGHFNKLRYSPSLRFVVFGAMFYTVASVQGSLEALRAVNLYTHFTHYTIGHAHAGLYGFFTMVMFGTIYYIVPRLTGWEWYSGKLIGLHFWTTAVGISLYFIALTIGGWWQGTQMAQAQPSFITIVQNTIPYLHLRSVAGTLMTVGHCVFALLFVLNLLHIGERRKGPTYFVAQKIAPQPLESAAVPAGV